MAMCTLSSPPATPWAQLRVQMGDPSLPITLTGPTRLIELFHFRRGKATTGVWVIINSASGPSPQPEEIDWSEFPIAEAQRALMYHEALCSRFALRGARAA